MNCVPLDSFCPKKKYQEPKSKFRPFVNLRPTSYKAKNQSSEPTIDRHDFRSKCIENGGIFWHRQPDFLGLTNETGKADVFFSYILSSQMASRL